MKNNKLKLEKFRIAELKNSSKIMGGTGVDDGATLTEKKTIKKMCLGNSEIIIEVPITD
jgi:hypothetical protein